VADAGPIRHEPADGVVRPRRPARRRGDDDAGPVPVAARVTLYHAADCQLCERALEVVEEARRELGFELELVDIGGVAELEERYREHLPVVEIDGERAFTYFVEPDAFRARLSA
jgi:glutaredoxin